MSQVAPEVNVPYGVEEALRLADIGWEVFPLNPENGLPFSNAVVARLQGLPEPATGSGGFHLATRDPDCIRAMWAHWPIAQIGIATGHRSGIYVLDIDRKNGKDGFAALEAAKFVPPPTFWVNSRSGGRHYFFAAETGTPCGTDCGVIGAGIDRKGDGGYVRWYGGAFGSSGAIPMAFAPDWMVAGAGSANGTGRRPLGTASLAAPSMQAAVDMLNRIDPNDLSYDAWQAITAAFRQAITTHDPSSTVGRIWWDAWCARYDRNDFRTNTTCWGSFDRGTDAGWAALCRRAGIVPGLRTDMEMPAPVAAPSQGVDCSGEILTPMEQAEWFKGCVLIGPDNRILDARGILYEPGGFNSSKGGKRFIVSSDGKVTDEAWKAATRGTQFRVPVVDGTVFRPDRPTGDIVADELSRRYVNRYVPAVIERMDGDPAPFLRHIDFMLPNINDQKILLDYLAHNAKFPGHKIPWAPVIQSAPGAGKNLIKHVMTHVIGNAYTHPVKAKELLANGGKFNSWMENKLFLVADEIKVGDRDVINGIKEIISEQTIEVESKGRDQRKADNVANWMFFTNYRDAVPTDINDRRFAIFYSAFQSKADLLRYGLDDAYFKALYDDWLGDRTHRKGLRIIANYLLDYPIERGAIPMRAPATASTDEAIAETRTPMEAFIADAADSGLPGFKGGWANTVALASKWRAAGNRDVEPATMGAALRTLGYHKIGRASRGWLEDDPANPNRRGWLWSVNPDNCVSRYGLDQGYPS